jgi:hypothetical protein
MLFHAIILIWVAGMLLNLFATPAATPTHQHKRVGNAPK